MKTLVFRVEYDGLQFSGFQRQKDPSLTTVQGLLESLLSQVLGEPIEVIGAGRTDTGVHATGQVVHVRTSSRLPLPRIRHAVWRLAHGRLGVPEAWTAPDWFHARHSAMRRVYQYHLLQTAEPSPLLAGRTWHVWKPLDLDGMQHEASTLLGRRDFKAFQAGGQVEHFFRTVYRFEVRPIAPATGSPESYLRASYASAPMTCIEIEADAFLPHMVRMLVGTLVDVGTGARLPGTAAAVLRGRNPRRSSAAAPPQGLCLVRVAYPAAVIRALEPA